MIIFVISEIENDDYNLCVYERGIGLRPLKMGWMECLMLDRMIVNRNENWL